MTGSRLVSRNVMGDFGRTSMRLEPELWSALDEMCRRERLGICDMVHRIGADAAPGGRTSAVRVGVLGYFRIAATERGHRDAGHGALVVGGVSTLD
jgi:predicted DNA-binding ribbon-helix-helix protein